MIIPQALHDKILRVFGDRGAWWLCHAPALADKAIERWRLSDVTLSPVLSHNLICFATSPQYGPVALKMGVPHDELFREMEALRAYGGGLACRLFEVRRDLAAMLLERISPGTDLWQVASRGERLRVLGSLMVRLPIPASSVTGIPRHSEVTERTFLRLRDDGDMDETLAGLLEAAALAERQLHADSRSYDILLHGDLNHWNILLDGSGTWRIIDPHGFIGPAVLDAGRFIHNEMTHSSCSCTDEELNGMVTSLASDLGTEKSHIASAALIDAVLSTCWNIEEGMPPAKRASRIHMCERLYSLHHCYV